MAAFSIEQMSDVWLTARRTSGPFWSVPFEAPGIDNLTDRVLVKGDLVVGLSREP